MEGLDAYVVTVESVHQMAPPNPGLWRIASWHYCHAIVVWRRGEELMDGDHEEYFEFLRDTRSGDMFVRAPQEGPCVQLRFLDSVPGDP